ncbi:deaminase [Granulosicoccus sp.]|nr:deaminase [Granulosicoccus sp.]MDB4223947.1 deaminase [Granulosicoccus sp.]
MNTTKCNQWDARFFALTNFIASWSEDDSRKVGSVLVSEDNQIISTGFNGLPRNISSKPRSRHSKENNQKYFWYEHAERNSIYNAVSTGISVKGATMYCNSYPCADCTRAIIQSGIVTLKTFNYSTVDSMFADHFEVADEMIEEAGIELFFYSRNDPLIKTVQSNFTSIVSTENDYFR